MPVKDLEKNTNEANGNINENQPVKEITQTDKLNKRLLQSFLIKINQGDHKYFNNAQSQQPDSCGHPQEPDFS
ncbi:unnamed protein product [Acanthoscelides obtectus]|uniref:Uncharacterized protein n=1 Tax=Acanthoscelides obtectus TaxID=200917 RepID=A0A9P0NY84_ACAOB|nr:unnamed protein product [Acanthoscelides obtectus]CAK1679355.1 hypothetical protein AOBTE_LOCUS32221 [Acanthoscelides obtectus]